MVNRQEMGMCASKGKQGYRSQSRPISSSSKPKLKKRRSMKGGVFGQIPPQPAKLVPAKMLFDFVGKSDQELSIKKDNEIEVLGEVQQWYIAQSREGKSPRIGFVPVSYVGRLGTIEVEPYFAPAMSRVDVEYKLIQPEVEVGEFKVRRSDNDKEVLVLDVKDESIVRHYKILKARRGFYIPKSQPYFDTVEDLIKHYQSRQDGLAVCLTSPARIDAQVPKPPASHPNLTACLSSFRGRGHSSYYD